MGVGASQLVILAAGEEQTLCQGPALLQSVVVSETTGSAPAAITVSGTDAAVLLHLAVPAGGSVAWSGGLMAAGSGVVVSCMSGEVYVCVVLQ